MCGERESYRLQTSLFKYLLIRYSIISLWLHKPSIELSVRSLKKVLHLSLGGPLSRWPKTQADVE